jgi:3-mercaptopyruvate sulfurtransferase SseA
MYNTLIDVTTLADHLDDPDWLVVDCRFSLADTVAGLRAYLAGHVPGAIYAHLDEDLSNPPVTDNGRHPLPAPEVLAARFARMGIGPATQVVAYDDANGMIAARLWWMLRYMGHEAAACWMGGGRNGWRQAAHSGLGRSGGQRPFSPDALIPTGWCGWMRFPLSGCWWIPATRPAIGASWRRLIRWPDTFPAR